MALYATIHSMDRAPITSRALIALTGTALLSSVSIAGLAPRIMMHPDSDMATNTWAQRNTSYAIAPIRSILSKQQLAELRSMGNDIDLIQPPNIISEFSTPTLDDASLPDAKLDAQYVIQMLDSPDGQLTPGRNMRFNVGRNTTLSDGNIAGTRTSIPGQASSISTMTQSEGEYNFYDMSVEWQAASAGAVELSFTSGVTAIQATASKRVQSGRTSTLYDVTNRVIAVPTIGSTVRWNISRGWSLSGQATTQSLDMGSSLMGFNAQSDWRISDRVGFSAGYQILKSEFDFGSVTSDLSQEGLFARLQIKF